MKLSQIRGCILNKRRGSMIIMLVMAVGTSSLLIANQYVDDRIMDFKVARATADGFKAFLLARAGLQGGIGALKKVPEEVLYQSGIAFNPPPIPMAGGTIFYRMSAEDGKININNLVRAYDGQPNLKVQEMVVRLFEQMAIPREKLFPIMDWIDENNEETGGGAEVYFYSGLKPPRKIKNGPLYNLSELTSVRGWSVKMLYESLKSPDQDKNTSKDFMSEEEKLLVTDSDYVLSNNITAFLPFRDTGDERININAAPYFVLMSLSDFMTKQAAMRILKFKLEKGGYIKEIGDLEKFPEFQVKNTLGFTLYNELVGEGGDSLNSGRVKTKGEIYKIVGVGIFGSATRRVTCLFDLTNDQILFYSED